MKSYQNIIKLNILKHKHDDYSHFIVERKKVEKVKIVDIDDIVYDLVKEFNERFYTFVYRCTKDGHGIRGFPKDILIRKFKYRLQDIVDLNITILSSFLSMKNSFYRQQPRSMLENKIIQLVDKNLNLLHYLPSKAVPVIRRFELKYWCQPYKNSYALFVVYIETEPHEKPLDLGNIL